MRLCNRYVVEWLEPRLLLSVSPQLAFGSYLGASGFESGYGVAPDGKGGVWVTGETRSTDLSTPGGFDTTYNGGGGDAYVTKLQLQTCAEPVADVVSKRTPTSMPSTILSRT
jgi:hypothetical protein